MYVYDADCSGSYPWVLFSVVCNRGINILLQLLHAAFVRDAAEYWFTDDFSVPVDNIGGRECRGVQCKLTGLAAGCKGDVAVGCPLGLQNLFSGSNGISIVIERFCIDADNLAALSLDGLIQLVQITKFGHARLAAAEPEIHDRKRVVSEQAAVHGVAVQVFALESGERAVGGCGGAFLGWKFLQLVLQLADLGGIVGQCLVVLGRELVLDVINRKIEYIGVVGALGALRQIVLVERIQSRCPQFLVLVEDGVFLRYQLGDGFCRFAAGGCAEQQAYGQGKCNQSISFH